MSNNNIMDAKDVFAEKICRALRARLGGRYRIRRRQVQKNNGVCLHGILIMEQGCNVSPTIYVDTLFEACEMGLSFQRAVERVLRIYENEACLENVDMSFFRDFERVKNRICFRLLGRNRNEALLEQIPHVPFLDLAICFYYAYEDDCIGEGIITICHSHTAVWNTDRDALLELAFDNTPRLFPGRTRSLTDLLGELIPEEQERLFAEDPEELPMYVLSNHRRVNGAACILYPGLLTGLSEKYRSDLYLIPSSVHEFLLIPDRGLESPAQLKSMIAEVNEKCLEEEDVLSDELYYFERKTGIIRTI